MFTVLLPHLGKRECGRRSVSNPARQVPSATGEDTPEKSSTGLPSNWFYLGKTNDTQLSWSAETIYMDETWPCQRRAITYSIKSMAFIYALRTGRPELGFHVSPAAGCCSVRSRHAWPSRASVPGFWAGDRRQHTESFNVRGE